MVEGVQQGPVLVGTFFSWAPTPTRPRPKNVGSGPQQPAQWAGSRGRGSG